MADQARKTVGQYVEWIGKYVEAALEDINNMRAAQQQAAGACWRPGPAAAWQLCILVAWRQGCTT